MLDPARSRWQRGAHIPLRAGTTIGRESGNAVVLDEDTVSAQHAVVGREGGRWYLQDLDSTNGTFINQRRIQGRNALKDGDELRFGRVATRFGPPQGQ